jgi:hypothetical protein
VPDASWSQQLTAMTSQLRMYRTEVDIRKNQEELAVRNVAQLLEQLRLAQQALAQVRAETEALRAAKPAN